MSFIEVKTTFYEYNNLMDLEENAFVLAKKYITKFMQTQIYKEEYSDKKEKIAIVCLCIASKFLEDWTIYCGDFRSKYISTSELASIEKIICKELDYDFNIEL